MQYDLKSPREGKDGKTHWQDIGVAFEAKGGGFNLVFNALPLPDKEGRVAVMMFERRKREERQQSAPSSGSAYDDNVPFAPQVLG